MSFSRCWANFSPLAMPVSRKAEPIPCYRHGLFREGLGQLKAIGSLALEQLWAISSMSFGRCWANSTLLAMPVSRGAGSIPCYRHCIFRGGLGQLNAIGSPASERPWAIGSMPFGRCWANPMLLAWSLWVRGWANSKPLVASPWSNSGPIPCYWPCLPQGKLGQSHAIGIVSLEGAWANSMPLVSPLLSDHGPFPAYCSSFFCQLPYIRLELFMKDRSKIKYNKSLTF